MPPQTRIDVHDVYKSSHEHECRAHASSLYDAINIEGKGVAIVPGFHGTELGPEEKKVVQSDQMNP